MGIIANIGRVFYGIAMAAMGMLTIYNRDLPYMMIPPGHIWLKDHLFFIYLCGFLLLAAGAFIIFERKPYAVPIALGSILSLVFCFYFVPYQVTESSRYLHFGTWENAAKELALAGGAFVIAGNSFGGNAISGLKGTVFSMGVFVYSLAIFSFSIDHFLFAKEAAGYIPDWIGHRVAWIYITGTALAASSLAILLGNRRRLAAGLLGSMIFIWVVILHIPKAVADSLAGGEVSSGFLALAYCGIAVVIAGAGRKNQGKTNP